MTVKQSAMFFCSTNTTSKTRYRRRRDKDSDPLEHPSPDYSWGKTMYFARLLREWITSAGQQECQGIHFVDDWSPRGKTKTATLMSAPEGLPWPTIISLPLSLFWETLVKIRSCPLIRFGSWFLILFLHPLVSLMSWLHSLNVSSFCRQIKARRMTILTGHLCSCLFFFRQHLLWWEATKETWRKEAWHQKLHDIVLCRLHNIFLLLFFFCLPWHPQPPDALFSITWSFISKYQCYYTECYQIGSLLQSPPESELLLLLLMLLLVFPSLVLSLELPLLEPEKERRFFSHWLRVWKKSCLLLILVIETPVTCLSSRPHLQDNMIGIIGHRQSTHSSPSSRWLRVK